MSLEPCKFCRYCVAEDVEHGRCHQGSPAIQRVTEKAMWPKVDLEGRDSGCGKFKMAGSATP